MAQELKISIENIRADVVKLKGIEDKTAAKPITSVLTHGNYGECQMAMFSVLQGASQFGGATNYLARVTSQFMSRVASEYENMDTSLAGKY